MARVVVEMGRDGWLPFRGKITWNRGSLDVGLRKVGVTRAGPDFLVYQTEWTVVLLMETWNSRKR